MKDTNNFSFCRYQFILNPTTKQLVTVWCKTFGAVNHTPNSKPLVREATQGFSSEKKSFPQTTNHKWPTQTKKNKKIIPLKTLTPSEKKINKSNNFEKLQKILNTKLYCKPNIHVLLHRWSFLLKHTSKHILKSQIICYIHINNHNPVQIPQKTGYSRYFLR